MVSGANLVGSVALDDYQPHSSDLDFVALLSHLPSAQEYARLKQIHREINARFPQPELEGMYLQEAHLGCQDGMCQPYFNYHDLHLYERDQMVLSAVTCWELKHCGLTLFGPPAQSLAIDIDLPYLMDTQRENLKVYWGSYLSHPRRMVTLLSDWGIQWAVLGVSRQFFTLREHTIASKTRAGEYALEHTPQAYHPILWEALSLRKNQTKSLEGTRLTRARRAYQYIVI